MKTLAGSLALLILGALALPAAADEPARFAPAGKFSPSWKPIPPPSEGIRAANQAQRLMAPQAGVHFRNPLSRQQEILVAGWESNALVVKNYQPEVKRYSRLVLPTSMLGDINAARNGFAARYYQGAGIAGRSLIVAGGTPGVEGTSAAYMSCTNRVFSVDVITKEARELPSMPTARAVPMVSSIRGGRYVVVAGGLSRADQRGSYAMTIHDGVEVFDRKANRWLDATEMQTAFPGLAHMPVGRYGGSVVYVSDAKQGTERLFVLGGTDANAFGAGSLNSVDPTRRVEVYDFKSGSWTTTHMPTARMFPGVAVRNHGGHAEIVVAGGGTGPLRNAAADPPVNAVERLDPAKLTWSFGSNLPGYQPVLTDRTREGNPLRFQEWSSDALVFAGRGRQCRESEHCYLFGFARAIESGSGKTAAEAQRPVVINAISVTNNIEDNRRTEITSIQDNRVRVEQTAINNTSISNTTNNTNKGFGIGINASR